MSKIEDGGPAYPARVSVNRDTGALQPHQFGNDDFCTEGMTLRDAMAIAALPVVATGSYEQGRDYLSPTHYDSAAVDAYRMADAMLKVRNSHDR